MPWMKRLLCRLFGHPMPLVWGRADCRRCNFWYDMRIHHSLWGKP